MESSTSWCSNDPHENRNLEVPSLSKSGGMYADSYHGQIQSEKGSISPPCQNRVPLLVRWHGSSGISLANYFGTRRSLSVMNSQWERSSPADYDNCSLWFSAHPGSACWIVLLRTTSENFQKFWFPDWIRRKSSRNDPLDWIFKCGSWLFVLAESTCQSQPAQKRTAKTQNKGLSSTVVLPNTSFKDRNKEIA